VVWIYLVLENISERNMFQHTSCFFGVNKKRQQRRGDWKSDYQEKHHLLLPSQTNEHIVCPNIITSQFGKSYGVLQFSGTWCSYTRSEFHWEWWLNSFVILWLRNLWPTWSPVLASQDLYFWRCLKQCVPEHLSRPGKNFNKTLKESFVNISQVFSRVSANTMKVCLCCRPGKNEFQHR
jgi:hypothetical protein